MRIKRQAVTEKRYATTTTTWLLRIVASLLAALVLLFFVSGLIHFLSSSSSGGKKNDAYEMSRGSGTTLRAVTNSGDAVVKRNVTTVSNNNHRILSLTIDTSPPTATTIRIAVLQKECPRAYQFLSFMVDNQETECNPCTIYRGEPVPNYWGSHDYPDRYFDHGRWGPPYALVQGGLVNSKFHTIEQDNHRPKILRRGMVAWAGGNSIHFFIALADHPEWGDVHTVWGEVLEEDMPLVDALVREHPLKVLEHNNPVVTNFVEPMQFHLEWG
jgi:hypothetical protein